MKRYNFLLGLNLFALTFLMLFYYIFYKDNLDAFTCTADVNHTAIKNNEKIIFDGDYDFILMAESNAAIYITGTFLYNNINMKLIVLIFCITRKIEMALCLRCK